MDQRLRTPALPSTDPAPHALPECVPCDASFDPAADDPTTSGFDRWWHAHLGQMTAGVSPPALLLAYADWLSHLALSPGKRAELVRKAWRKGSRYALYLPHAAGGATRCIEPLQQDKRFVGESWQHFPFNAWSQSFLLWQQWWHNATTGVRGVSRHHEEVVTFITRQLLDIVSPSNFPLTNPEVLERSATTFGANLVAGCMHWWEDVERLAAGRPACGSDAFQPGRDVAVTRGKVVLRNDLCELIQYDPTTPQVHPQPVLILPAWIMKYYVLDLQPQDSLVKYLVDQGHTVFCVSWKNPGAADRDRGMDDYLRLGLLQTLDAVCAIVPGARVHAVGYCLGGTLLAIGAAALARRNDQRLATLTLLAAQTDFTEPGEIGLFIDDAEVAFLEDMMFDAGCLTREQMAGAFQLLRSNDLVWSRAVRDYLMGERAPMTALMAWNQDATRMPYRMHSEYLRSLFLGNDLAAGRFQVDGRPVALTDIRQPVFCLGTETDHVAPWRSVYKLHLLTDTEVTFVLTTGGHNAGVVSPPGHPRRSYRARTQGAGDRYLDPDQYLAQASPSSGSWWPCWQAWLAAHSDAPAHPPGMGAPQLGLPVLGAAPGRYVLMK